MVLSLSNLPRSVNRGAEDAHRCFDLEGVANRDIVVQGQADIWRAVEEQGQVGRFTALVPNSPRECDYGNFKSRA